MKCRRRYSRPVDKTTGLRCDQTIILSGFYSRRDYPEVLRRISFRDPETKKLYVFLTNNFSEPALNIAQLYRCRWNIELFFKWTNNICESKPSTALRRTPFESKCGSPSRLSARRYFQKKSSVARQPLHNSTGSKCDTFRENPHFTGIFTIPLQTMNPNINNEPYLPGF